MNCFIISCSLCLSQLWGIAPEHFNCDLKYRKFAQAKVVDDNATIRNDDCSTDAIHQLIRFLSYLRHGDDQLAYSIVAPSSTKNGDPIAYNAALDWSSFKKELSSETRGKFGDYHLGELRWESPKRLRVFVHFAGGDNDETVLVCENGQWFVADPIHIIR